MQDRVREKLKNFNDYDDFLKNFENHREKNEHRTKIMREDGFKDINDKYGSKYDFWDSAKYENAHKYDYFQKGEMYFGGYFDTKANGIYYD